ncbi:MAG: tetratricopeptide repeat-containing sensor histidine kinase [Candidatus Cloacimonetes bacterium]|nr:tetratricopeptide repeat-containing sensor histidine kinase [Candidatus Cloacimonadota bacterium]
MKHDFMNYFSEPLKKVWESKDGINGLSSSEIQPVIEAIDDFLKKFKHKCSIDTKLKLMVMRAEGLGRIGNYDEALLQYQELRMIAEQHHNNYYKIKAVNGIAVNYMVHGEFLQGIECWESIIAEIEDPRQKADIHNNLGIAYAMMDKCQKALENHYNSLKIDEELGSEQDVGTNYLNLANTYWRLQQFDKCLELNLQATAIFEKCGSYRYLSSSYGNIGSLYTEMGDYEKALQYASKSLALKEKYANAVETAITLTTLGSIYRNLKDYDTSLEYYNKALATYVENKDQYSIAFTNLNIGWAYYEMGNIEEASRQVKASLKQALEIDNPTVLMGNYKLLYIIHKHQNQHKKALAYHEKYFETYNKLFHENPKLMLAQSEADFYRKKTEQHAEIYRLGNIELSKKNRIVSQKSKQLNAANIQMQKHVSFLSGLVSVIAHDIRGPIASVSQAIKMIIAGSFSDAELAELLGQMSVSTDNSIAIINDILFWIRNSQPGAKLILAEVNIIPILKSAVSLYRNMASLKNIQVLIPADKSKIVLAESSFLQVVFRNLLHNALKFSPHDSQIKISIREDARHIYIDFCDHGSGMSKAEVDALLSRNKQKKDSSGLVTGFGIGLCVDYLGQMKGKLLIVSNTDSGSIISARLLKAVP